MSVDSENVLQLPILDSIEGFMKRSKHASKKMDHGACIEFIKFNNAFYTCEVSWEFMLKIVRVYL